MFVIIRSRNLSRAESGFALSNTCTTNIPIPAGYAIRTRAENSPRYRYVVDGADKIHYEASVSPGQMNVLAPDEGYTNYAYRLDFPGNGTFSWHFIPIGSKQD